MASCRDPCCRDATNNAAEGAVSLLKAGARSSRRVRHPVAALASILGGPKGLFTGVIPVADQGLQRMKDRLEGKGTLPQPRRKLLLHARRGFLLHLQAMRAPELLTIMSWPVVKVAGGTSPDRENVMRTQPGSGVYFVNLAARSCTCDVASSYEHRRWTCKHRLGAYFHFVAAGEPAHRGVHVEDAELDAVYEQLCKAFSQMRLDAAPGGALTGAAEEVAELDGSSVDSVADVAEGEATVDDPDSWGAFDDGEGGWGDDDYSSHAGDGRVSSEGSAAAVEEELAAGSRSSSSSAAGGRPASPLLINNEATVLTSCSAMAGALHEALTPGGSHGELELSPLRKAAVRKALQHALGALALDPAAVSAAATSAGLATPAQTSKRGRDGSPASRGEEDRPVRTRSAAPSTPQPSTQAMPAPAFVLQEEGGEAFSRIWPRLSLGSAPLYPLAAILSPLDQQ